MKTAALATLAAAAAAQEQIHLSLTGKPTEMAVSWAVPGACSPVGNALVQYGTSKSSLTHSVTGDGVELEVGDVCLFAAVMTGLSANTRYYYRIGQSGSINSFMNQPVHTGRDVPARVYAVTADFGLSNDVSMQQLVAEASNGQIDGIIHAGDLAYDLQDSKGQTGNQFMQALSGAASQVFFNSVNGNHEEIEDRSTGGYNTAQYSARFKALEHAAKNSGSSSMLWYSFNDGPVHFVGINTELFAYGGTPTQIKEQASWLEDDLKSVDRSVTPWVVSLGHKQYWMDKVDFTQLNQILQGGGVDIYLTGHQHNYQRVDPTSPAGDVETDCVNAAGTVYTDCTYMLTLVVGSPGCKEKISNDHAPKGLRVFEQAYGYGHLSIFNASHALWQWEETGQRDLATGEFVRRVGSFVDHALIVKNNH